VVGHDCEVYVLNKSLVSVNFTNGKNPVWGLKSMSAGKNLKGTKRRKGWKEWHETAMQKSMVVETPLL